MKEGNKREKIWKNITKEGVPIKSPIYRAVMTIISMFNCLLASIFEYEVAIALKFSHLKKIFAVIISLFIIVVLVSAGNVVVKNGILNATGIENNYFAGNVGIGISTPTKTLHVVGSANVSSGLNVSGGLEVAGGIILSGTSGSQGGTNRYISSGGEAYSWYYNAPNGGNYYFAIAEGTKMFIQSTGNVGIGTVSPAHKLEVAGSMNISGDLNVSGNVTSNGNVTSKKDFCIIGGNCLSQASSIDLSNYPTKTDLANNITMVNNSVKTWVYNGTLQMKLVNSSNITCIGNQCFYNGSTGGGGGSLWTPSGSDIYREGGNVGIGTANPLVKLSVNGTTGSDILNVSNGTVIGLYVNKYSNVGIGTMSPGKKLVVAGSANISGGLNVSEGLIVNTGNVGIGTVGPGGKLDITGTGDMLRLTGTGTANTLIRFRDDGSETAAIYTLNGVTDLYLRAVGGVYIDGGSGSNGDIFVKSDGNVGIGKTSPKYRLDVNGGINASSLNVSGDVALAVNSGNVGIGTANPTSTLHVVGNLNVSGRFNLPIGNPAPQVGDMWIV